MTAFNNERYLKLQAENILKRIEQFNNKLYLEFGGKIFDDYHASRVLPGFQIDSKVQMLLGLRDKVEVIITISARDIETSKMRADYGISYEDEVLRMIDAFHELDLYVGSVVITKYNKEPEVKRFERKLKSIGIPMFYHYQIEGYPTDTDKIVSEEGFGKNDFIETTRSLIVVTAPGPGSGKMATCLSQLYHENKRGVNAGYAKFETFPVWNLNLMHPVNIAYEAATVDLEDINMIDSFHLESYGENAVSYNRDLSTFPILKNILKKITGKEIYKSPTDMGVNMIKQCITDDEVVRKAAEAEIIRRYYNAMCDHKKGLCSQESAQRIEIMMNKLDISAKDRKVIEAALAKEEKEKKNVVAIELPNGKIITGKESTLLSASSAALINVLKEITNIPEEMFLLSPSILEGIFKTKQNTSSSTTYNFLKLI